MKMPKVYLEMIGKKRAELAGVLIIPYGIECNRCGGYHERRVFVAEVNAHAGARVDGSGRVFSPSYGADLRRIADEAYDGDSVASNIEEFRDLRRFSGTGPFSIAVLRGGEMFSGEEALPMAAEAYTKRMIVDNADLLRKSLNSAVRTFRKSGMKLNPKSTYTIHVGRDEKHARFLAQITHPGQTPHILGRVRK